MTCKAPRLPMQSAVLHQGQYMCWPPLSDIVRVNQIGAGLSRTLTPDDDVRRRIARELDLATTAGIKQPHGRQLLAQQGGHDGFYYALLSKDTA